MCIYKVSAKSRALRAHVPTCRSCSRANVPCVLTCSRANVSCVLTCSRANVPCLLMSSRANVPCVLSWLRANVPSVPTCSLTVTLYNKNKLSITCFTQIFGTFSFGIFPVK